MSLRVNRTTKTGHIQKPEREGNNENEERKVNIKFDSSKKIKDNLEQRIEKFNKLKIVYTNQDEYNAALKKSIADGTYNPDAPQFIYADKKFTESLIYLESITGDYSIVRQDGTVNTEKYKEAMKIISNDMDIDATERYSALELDGIPKSKLKLLAEPLGIKLLTNKESEILRQERIKNTPPHTLTADEELMSMIYDS